MRSMIRPRNLPMFVSLLALSCSITEEIPDGDAGSAGTSGSSSGSGGVSPAGGTSAKGGTSGAGGSAAGAGTGGSSGGSAPTGGAGTGGSGGGTGGSAGRMGGGAGRSGNAGAGGASSGGAGTTGGDGGTSGGSAGAGAGGVSGGAGAAGTSGSGGGGEATPSAGCGKAAPMSQRYSIDVDGTMREYILSVPNDYDENTPYRLIFAWHPWGGSAQQVAGNGNSGYYGLKGASMDQAVLVSPEGTDFGGNGLGWGNTNGQDIAFLEAMLERFKSEMCIDEARVFSVGFSFGGMMSNAVGCAGLARAIAPMAGNSMVSGCVDGTTPVAYMGFHGDHDSVVNIEDGRRARDEFVQRNHCSMDTQPANPDWCTGLNSNNMPCSCVSYQGCDAGYPVTWCEYNADHQAAPNSGPTLWNFFSQF